MNCLLCGTPYAQEAHFPRAVGAGRNRKKVKGLSTVWLCFECHIEKLHHGDHETIEKLITAAPAYWKSVGRWGEYKEAFETWLVGWNLKLELLKS